MLGEHSSTNIHTTQTYFQKTASWGLGAEEPKEECPQVHMPACKNVSHTDLERDTGFALDSSVEMHDFACLCIRVLGEDGAQTSKVGAQARKEAP